MGAGTEPLVTKYYCKASLSMYSKKILIFYFTEENELFDMRSKVIRLQEDVLRLTQENRMLKVERQELQLDVNKFKQLYFSLKKNYDSEEKGNKTLNIQIKL